MNLNLVFLKSMNLNLKIKNEMNRSNPARMSEVGQGKGENCAKRGKVGKA